MITEEKQKKNNWRSNFEKLFPVLFVGIAAIGIVFVVFALVKSTDNKNHGMLHELQFAGGCIAFDFVFLCFVCFCFKFALHERVLSCTRQYNGGSVSHRVYTSFVSIQTIVHGLCFCV